MNWEKTATRMDPRGPWRKGRVSAKDEMPVRVVEGRLDAGHSVLSRQSSVAQRASGTEPVVRVMVEAADPAAAQFHAEVIAAVVEANV